MNLSLLTIFLPDDLLAHCAVVDCRDFGDVISKKECIFIYLDEKNLLPNGFNSSDFKSKRFYERKVIQYFRIRGKAVYLAIKRRRWRSKIDKSIQVNSDFSL